MERARREFEVHAAAAFVWGYGHYFVLAAAGAGLSVAIDPATGVSELSDVPAGLVATVPVAVYVLAVWLLHYRDKTPGPLRSFVLAAAAALVLAASLTPEPVLVARLVLAGLVALSVVLTSDRPATSRPRASAARAATGV